MTSRQIPDLLDAAYDDSVWVEVQERNEAIVALLYDTGLRPCELVGLDVAHLELDGDRPHIVLPGDVQKDYPVENRSPDTATILLDRDVARTLRRYLARRWRDSPAVFPSRQSDRITTQTLRNVVSGLATTAGTRPRIKGRDGRGTPDDVTPYTFRHSIAHRVLVEEEGTLEDVTRRLRHTSVQTTMDYYEMFVPR